MVDRLVGIAVVSCLVMTTWASPADAGYVFRAQLPCVGVDDCRGGASTGEDGEEEGLRMSGVVPANRSADVSPVADLSVTFNRVIEAGGGQVVIYRAEGDALFEAMDVADTAHVGFSGTRVVIDPEKDLSPYTEYYVTVPSGAFMDADGNLSVEVAAPVASSGWSFTTRDLIPPGAGLSISPEESRGMDIAGGTSPGITVVFTISNGGDFATQALALLLDNATSFALVDDNCSGQILSPAVSCTVGVQPLAASNGYYEGGLLVSEGGGGHVLAYLNGTAAGFGGASALWCWGANDYGQLGDGSINEDANPGPVNVSLAVSQIADPVFSDYNCAVKNDGGVWCWGLNDKGQLGNGTMVDSSYPVHVMDPMDSSGFLTGVSKVAIGTKYSCAVKQDGTVWCWGNMSYSVSGNVAAQISGLSDVEEVAVGNYHVCALKTDETVWCWGYNVFGQLGRGSTSSSSSPVQLSISGISEIRAGFYNSCALKTDGTVWCWGYNANGQVGDGTTATRLSPVQVGIDEVVSLKSGANNSYAIRSDGTLWGWGANFFGQLGDGTTDAALVPKPIMGLSGVSYVSVGSYHSCALANGMWCWGLGWAGQLGDGNTEDRLVPVPVTVLSGIASIATTSGHTCAIAAGSAGDTLEITGLFPADGGGNVSPGTKLVATFNHIIDPGVGNLTIHHAGDNAVFETIPVTDYRRLSYEGKDLVINPDGVFACGESYYVLIDEGGFVDGGGNIFAGLSEDSDWYFTVGSAVLSMDPASDDLMVIQGGSSPGGAHEFTVTNICDASSGGAEPTTPITVTIPDPDGHFNTLADTCSGASLSAGENCVIRVEPIASGNGTYSTTITASAETGGDAVSGVSGMASGFIGGTASLWCWGKSGATHTNYYGQLGDGTNINRLAPTLVVDEDGSSPFEDAVDVEIGYNHTCAVKRDGSLWCWGNNWWGQLGNGSTAHSNMPVEVTGISGVVKVALNQGNTCAITSDSNLYCWGINDDYQLGLGYDNAYETTPQLVASGVSDIDVGYYHMCAVIGGRVECWGWNSLGLGVMTTAEAYDTQTSTVMFCRDGSSPVSWGGMLSFDAVCPDDTEASVWRRYQIDDYNIVYHDDGYIEHVYSGGDGCQYSGTPDFHVEDGKIIWPYKQWLCAMCGRRDCNASGDLVTLPEPSAPITINTGLKESSVPIDITNGIGVAVGANNSCSVSAGGTVSCWGQNRGGQCGFPQYMGTSYGSTTPVVVAGVSDVDAISSRERYFCALENSSVWCWGDGSYQPRRVANAVGGESLSGIMSVDVAMWRACAASGNGTAWCWDSGGLAQQIGMSEVVDIAAGVDYTCVVKLE